MSLIWTLAMMFGLASTYWFMSYFSFDPAMFTTRLAAELKVQSTDILVFKAFQNEAIAGASLIALLMLLCSVWVGYDRSQSSEKDSYDRFAHLFFLFWTMHLFLVFFSFGKYPSPALTLMILMVAAFCSHLVVWGMVSYKNIRPGLKPTS